MIRRIPKKINKNKIRDAAESLYESINKKCYHGSVCIGRDNKLIVYFQEKEKSLCPELPLNWEGFDVVPIYGVKFRALSQPKDYNPNEE